MEVSTISYCERYHLSPQIITVIYWEPCNVPNAFKTSFILSSPFSPPLNGSGHRWQQTSLLDDEGRAHVLHHTAPSTLENVRWKFFSYSSLTVQGVGEGHPLLMSPEMHSTGVPPPLQKFLDILQKFLENSLQAPGPPLPCSRCRKQFTGADEAKCLHLFQTPH